MNKYLLVMKRFNLFLTYINDLLSILINTLFSIHINILLSIHTDPLHLLINIITQSLKSKHVSRSNSNIIYNP